VGQGPGSVSGAALLRLGLVRRSALRGENGDFVSSPLGWESVSGFSDAIGAGD